MDVTTTVQTLLQAKDVVQGAQALAGQTSWAHVALAAVVGGALVPVGQAVVEHWTASPAVTARVKSIAPSALALGLGYLSTRFNVTPEQATAAASIFAGGVHVWNETRFAAVSTAPTVKTVPSVAPAAAPVVGAPLPPAPKLEPFAGASTAAPPALPVPPTPAVLVSVAPAAPAPGNP